MFPQRKHLLPRHKFVKTDYRHRPELCVPRCTFLSHAHQLRSSCGVESGKREICRFRWMQRYFILGNRQFLDLTKGQKECRIRRSRSSDDFTFTSDCQWPNILNSPPGPTSRKNFILGAKRRLTAVIRKRFSRPLPSRPDRMFGSEDVLRQMLNSNLSDVLTGMDKCWRRVSCPWSAMIVRLFKWHRCTTRGGDQILECNVLEARGTLEEVQESCHRDTSALRTTKVECSKIQQIPPGQICDGPSQL
jgi:hypothetical protein